MKSLFIYIIFLPFITITSSCSGAGIKEKIPSEIVFAGSTPGDEAIKSLLTIPAATKVDFIRWNLLLNDKNSDSNTFRLDIVFGEVQPNTPGFAGGGEKLSFAGQYTISNKKNEIINGEIYHLTSNQLRSEIVMMKLNDNLFHLLTPQNQFMIGNGGWSYTLNRKEPIKSKILFSLNKTLSSTLLNDTSRQIVFDGRTPCQTFATDHEMNVSSSCFKLKWRLILNRDSISRKPTTYTIRKVVDNSPRNVTGTWTIIKGSRENTEAIIYQLHPQDSKKTISLLAGDENVIFFLANENELYTGNENFSFTLNKKQLPEK